MRVDKRISTLFLVALLSSCSWLSVLDTSQCEDKENSLQIKEETRQLDLEYKGAGYNQIKSVFGRPRRIEKEGKGLIITDKKCVEDWEGVMRWGDCEAGKADEVWVYEFKDRDKCGWVFYSRNIVFVDGKVVEIR